MVGSGWMGQSVTLKIDVKIIVEKIRCMCYLHTCKMQETKNGYRTQGKCKWAISLKVVASLISKNYE